MPHAIWNGSISFGLVSIPVEVYPGEKRDELSFTQLDRRDVSPVGYRKYNKNTGKEVPPEEIVRGMEYEEGEYVVLTDDDLKNANVKATQTIDIVDFVDASSISPVYFDRPYYLAPAQRGQKGYALLRETLKRTGKAGVANVVIHTRQHLSLVMPIENILVLELLRYAYEIRDVKELEVPGKNLAALNVNDKELDMAQRLVKGMVAKWEPDKYRDKYRDDLLKLIKRKVAKGETRKAEEPVSKETTSAEVIDIMALLKKSIEDREKKKAA